jgi:hypothetical protein
MQKTTVDIVAVDGGNNRVDSKVNFITISQTSRSEFMLNFLKSLCVSEDFFMHSKAKSGGILQGTPAANVPT